MMETANSSETPASCKSIYTSSCPRNSIFNVNKIKKLLFWNPHVAVGEEYCVLWYDTVWFGRNLQTFAWTHCLQCYTLKMEALRSSQKTWRPLTEVKNAWNFSSTGPYDWMWLCLVTHRDSYSFYWMWRCLVTHRTAIPFTGCDGA